MRDSYNDHAKDNKNLDKGAVPVSCWKINSSIADENFVFQMYAQNISQKSNPLLENKVLSTNLQLTFQNFTGAGP